MLLVLGIDFDIVAPDLDETVRSDESPHEAVSRLAAEKAAAVAERHPEAWVIGADTAVVVDAHFLGKPAGTKEAYQMLRLISGRDHIVFGGFVLMNKDRGVKRLHLAETVVTINQLSEEAIGAYIETGEPMDKAGAYAVQGIGAHIVARLHGSYTNVVGLDVPVLVGMLVEEGAITIDASDADYH
jgi:septum formation protein